jgi:Flp pilus assembly protein TadG
LNALVRSLFRQLRHRDESGSVVVEWILGICLLLLPTAGLLSFPAWVERQNMARLGAQEAARAVALADDTAAGTAEGSTLVDEIARNHGIDPATVSVSYAGTTSRGGSVSATVSVQLPALTLPGLGSVGSVTWSTSHTERVDQYRGFN